MALTYEPIATTTASGSPASVTFSGIPATYTDIVLICNAVINSGTEDALGLRFNTDTGGNYSGTGIYAGSSVAGSYRGSNAVKLDAGTISLSRTTSIIHIMNYSNTTTYKTVISKGYGTGTSSYIRYQASVWRTTGAIDSINISPYNNQGIATGSIFTLYGIKAA